MSALVSVSYRASNTVLKSQKLHQEKLLFSRSMSSEATGDSSEHAAQPPLTPFDRLEQHAIMTREIDASEHLLPPDALTPDNRLRRSFSNLWTIFQYLGRFQDEEEAAAFLLSFEKDEVAESESELYKARAATSTLITSVVHNLQNIPENASIRSQGKMDLVFQIYGALLPLHDVYFAGQKTPEPLPGPEWSAFWDRAQPILLTLAQAIDDAGLGSARGEASSS